MGGQMGGQMGGKGRGFNAKNPAVIAAEAFAERFDGFSIGSNDLTQLTLGLDRDSALVADLFDERHPSVLAMIALAIRTAKRCGRKIGLCGQAPSDYPEFARFLVAEGIDSISLNPDAVVRTRWSATNSVMAGRASVVMMATIDMTIISSISVKPCFTRRSLTVSIRGWACTSFFPRCNPWRCRMHCCYRLRASVARGC
jgi:signal transduction protein with GAF and PtsI domain